MKTSEFSLPSSAIVTLVRQREKKNFNGKRRKIEERRKILKARERANKVRRQYRFLLCERSVFVEEIRLGENFGVVMRDLKGAN